MFIRESLKEKLFVVLSLHFNPIDPNPAISAHAVFPQSGHIRPEKIPKGCGCIGFLSPMHKKIPDFYSEREGGNPGNSGLSSQQ